MPSAQSTDWGRAVTTIGTLLTYDDSTTTYDSISVIYESQLSQLVTSSTDWSQLYGSISIAANPPVMDDAATIMDDTVAKMEA